MAFTNFHRFDPEIDLLRFEELLQASIVEYGEDVNFEDLSALYQVLLEHLMNGDFASIFRSSYIDDLELEKKEEMMKIAQKYSSFCFFGDGFEEWAESIEGTLGESEFVCMRVINNYDFLLRLIHEGGENVVSGIQRYLGEDKYIPVDSPLEFLRCSFRDDDALVQVLCALAREDSFYEEFFSPLELSLLLSIPQGNLFYYEEDQVKLISPMISSMALHRRMNEEDAHLMMSEDEAPDFQHLELFENSALNIHLDYRETIPGYELLSVIRIPELRRDWSVYVNSPYGEKVVFKR